MFSAGNTLDTECERSHPTSDDHKCALIFTFIFTVRTQCGTNTHAGVDPTNTRQHGISPPASPGCQQQTPHWNTQTKVHLNTPKDAHPHPCTCNNTGLFLHLTKAFNKNLQLRYLPVFISLVTGILSTVGSTDKRIFYCWFYCFCSLFSSFQSGFFLGFFQNKSLINLRQFVQAAAT